MIFEGMEEEGFIEKAEKDWVPLTLDTSFIRDNYFLDDDDVKF